jgi:hypothetical protein
MKGNGIEKAVAILLDTDRFRIIAFTFFTPEACRQFLERNGNDTETDEWQIDFVPL